VTKTFATQHPLCVVFCYRSGFIGQQRLRAVFLAMRVPVELDVLRAVIQASVYIISAGILFLEFFGVMYNTFQTVET